MGFHQACGSIKTPFVRKCPTHQQRAVKLPGTASAVEIVFYCPVCNVTIQRGFGANCDCDQGGVLSFTVHRSGSVFKPRGVVLINPPRREILRQVEAAGGGERALNWIVNGMQGRRLTDAPTNAGADSIRMVLAERGFDQATIDAMVAAMPPQSIPDSGFHNVDDQVLTKAKQQARQIALANFESRRTISDLEIAASGERARALYQIHYPESLRLAGIERVELVDRFPVLTAQYGYTRGDAVPGSSRLRTYREKNGEYTAYGELIETEALFIRLNPAMVHRWLSMNGIDLAPASDARAASAAILEALAVHPDGTEDEATKQLITLIHSYSHAFIRRAAVYAGIERSALSELVLPYCLGFFVYAAAKGDFVLGGLQALFESDLHSLIDGLVQDEHRCALDPGCTDHGAACGVCLHLGEPSCRMFNMHLSRLSLAGRAGYFDLCSN
ncbi:hypothetical protein OCA5_c03630 [Afipia carboxidovorans OM5]|uniref:Uncharacterized protein n=1 Tax=Afipia carboxidovorans (strain ATCC 49405 / DSM 1227 / KCTC 32145 / OM5) TaxID=504832 RepID=F8BUN6_AFIC5|nr:hypothetical protein OCA4_c03620 [Afipia carboxidovorans OM4]AEI05089.1 hypothetical protein OCA5_c03630 [Afipia carboxidovorans OM5]